MAYGSFGYAARTEQTVNTETTISTHYQGEAGRRYAAHHQADPSHLGYQLDAAYFLPYLKPSDVLLDFGCGNGGMLRVLRDKVQRADGLEVNPTAADTARSSGLRVYASMAELPSEPVYDVVISNHVLEHVRDVPSTLERVRASMKSEGTLLLKLPLDDWRARKQQTWSRDDIDHHLQTWTPRLIGNVLFEAGYDVDDVQILTSAWHPALFPLVNLGLGPLVFWALSIIKKRRQLFVVGRVPA